LLLSVHEWESMFECRAEWMDGANRLRAMGAPDAWRGRPIRG